MSKWEKALKIIGAAVIVAAALWLSFMAGRWSAPDRPNPQPEPKVDTLYLRDTIVQNRPVYVKVTKLDSVLVPVTVRDTVTQSDTVLVWMNREQVEWRDSLCTVWASGVLPQVDSVAHYVTQTVIRVRVKEKTRWGLGVQAGVGTGKDGLTPYLGLGVSYNLLGW